MNRRTVISGGPILTMAAEMRVEAVAVLDERILHVGSLADCRDAAGRDAAEFDLGAGERIGIEAGDLTGALRKAERQHRREDPRVLRVREPLVDLGERDRARAGYTGGERWLTELNLLGGLFGGARSRRSIVTDVRRASASASSSTARARSTTSATRPTPPQRGFETEHCSTTSVQTMWTAWSC